MRGIRRNLTILEHADLVLAFWDGQSRGTKFVIDNARRMRVEVRVWRIENLLIKWA